MSDRPSEAQGSMFEALFTRALKPSSAMLEELRSAGYDQSAPRPTYPTPVWVQSLEIAVRHTYPALARSEGYRQMGRRFTQGFMDTLAGKVVAVAMPFLKAGTFLNRMPRYMNLGRSDVRLELFPEGPQQVRGRVTDPFGVPAEFLAGILEVGMELTKASPGITVHKLNESEHDLHIRW